MHIRHLILLIHISCNPFEWLLRFKLRMWRNVVRREGDTTKQSQAGGWEPGARPRDWGPGHTSAHVIGQSPRYPVPDWPLVGMEREWQQSWLVPCLVYSSVSGGQASGVSRQGHQVNPGHQWWHKEAKWEIRLSLTLATKDLTLALLALVRIQR